jgi:hypothetical protein
MNPLAKKVLVVSASLTVTVRRKDLLERILVDFRNDIGGIMPIFVYHG